MKETVSSNTVYTISSKDGRVLEVAGFARHAGAAVQLWESAGSASQQWVASEVKPGVYKLENRLSGKVLALRQMPSQSTLWHRIQYNNGLLLYAY